MEQFYEPHQPSWIPEQFQCQEIFEDETAAIQELRNELNYLNLGQTFTEDWAENMTPPMPKRKNSIKKKKKEVVETLENQKLYKTELCRSFLETGTCGYGSKCQFAHGDNEVRNVPRHPKYKTTLCRSYVKTGTCNYGERCHFVHESPSSTPRGRSRSSSISTPQTRSRSNSSLAPPAGPPSPRVFPNEAAVLSSAENTVFEMDIPKVEKKKESSTTESPRRLSIFRVITQAQNATSVC